jgi:hypothetical protein
MVEKVEFPFFGLDLLEPMALITNGLVATVCFSGFRRAHTLGLTKWFYFFVFFATASLSGAFSHLFWNYWGFYGKIMPWFFGVLSLGFLVAAIADLFDFNRGVKEFINYFLFFKGVFVLSYAYLHWNFMFVALDTILSLFVACGIGSSVLYFVSKRRELKNLLLGFLIMFPSAFVFLLKLDLHLWLNREDLSHILIASGLYFFVLNLTHIHNPKNLEVIN